METKQRIFCFIQSKGPGGVTVMAMCEDGHVLGSHFSSDELWAMHDIGINSDWKHDKYNEHCPGGFELVWLSETDTRAQMHTKAGFLYDAWLKNQELGQVARETKKEPQ